MNEISKKKPLYKVNPKLHAYVEEYGRAIKLPVNYNDLLGSARESFPLTDKDGNDTLWESMLYDHTTHENLDKGLTMIYALLKAGGDTRALPHLKVDRIDYCTFGNSKPFRIKIVNLYNDNYDYFYVKKTDASRIYGLDLEHILSPNRINYFVDSDTLIEEHIAGIPGDQFINDYLDRPTVNHVRLAKEFVKFNERCFVRLLGDMRSYNYVLDITPDFDAEQYRVRAIDFDQQSYEGKKTMYLPQYFKENNPIVKLCLEHINIETARQYQHEERTLIARRLKSSRYRLKDLIDCMQEDTLSTPEKTHQLKQELADFHQSDDMLKSTSMGDVVKNHLKLILR